MPKYKNKVQDDYIIGTQESDTILTGSGNDFIHSYSIPGPNDFDARRAFGDKADLINAGSGDDTILSGGGNDTVYGGPGDDLIDASRGNDIIYGGPGRDVFQFAQLFVSTGPGVPSSGVGEGNRDVIMDFKQGQDKIDVTGWERSSYTPDGGAIWTGESNPVDGQLLTVGYHYEGDNTIVELTLPIFPATSFSIGVWSHAQIELQGHYDLKISDFIF